MNIYLLYVYQFVTFVNVIMSNCWIIPHIYYPIKLRNMIEPWKRHKNTQKTHKTHTKTQGQGIVFVQQEESWKKTWRADKEEYYLHMRRTELEI